MNQTILAHGLQSRYACVFFNVLFISNLHSFSIIFRFLVLNPLELLSPMECVVLNQPKVFFFF